LPADVNVVAAGFERVDDGMDVQVGNFKSDRLFPETFTTYTNEVSPTLTLKSVWGKLSEAEIPDELKLTAPVGPPGIFTFNNWFVFLFAINPFIPPHSGQSTIPLGPFKKLPGFPNTLAVGTFRRLLPKSRRVSVEEDPSLQTKIYQLPL
jgi:hypothetical protein